MPAQALQLIDEIRSHPALLPVASTNRTEMLFVETSAHLANGDLKSAEARRAGGLGEVSRRSRVCWPLPRRCIMNYQCYSNALATINQQLKVSPTNLVALVNKGFACIQLGAYEQAIPPLTRVLDLDTNNYSARSTARSPTCACDKLDAAQRHYEVAAKSFPERLSRSITAWRKLPGARRTPTPLSAITNSTCQCAHQYSPKPKPSSRA